MEDLNERDKSSGLSSLSSAAGSLSGPRGTNVVGTVGASAMRESGQTSSPMGSRVGRCDRSCRVGSLQELPQKPRSERARDERRTVST